MTATEVIGLANEVQAHCSVLIELGRGRSSNDENDGHDSPVVLFQGELSRQHHLINDEYFPLSSGQLLSVSASLAA